MSGGQATVTMPGCGPVIVNAGQSGYYRTLYAPAPVRAPRATASRGWRRSISSACSPTRGRWGCAGLQPASDLLDLAAATPDDADPQVWGQIAEIFDRHRRVLPRRRAPQAPSGSSRSRGSAGASPGWAGMPRPASPTRSAILRNAADPDPGEPSATAAVIDEARRRYARAGHRPQGDAGRAAQDHPRGGRASTPMTPPGTGCTRRRAGRRRRWSRTSSTALLASTEDEALAKARARAGLDRRARRHQQRGDDRRASPASIPTWPSTSRSPTCRQVEERLDATSRSRYYAGLAAQSADPAMLGKLHAYANAHVDARSRRSRTPRPPTSTTGSACGGSCRPRSRTGWPGRPASPRPPARAGPRKRS